MLYRELFEIVLHTLGAEKGGTYSDALVYDAICNATDAILPWIPKAAITVLTTDGILDRFDLPTDCYNVEAIQDISTGSFVERDIIASGKIRNGLTNLSSRLFAWIEYPRGELYLSCVLETLRTIRVYYTAYFNKPVNSQDFDFVIDTPRFAIPGIVYWSCAHCILPFATGSAQIRQWNQRIDSGSPTDNVLEQNARFYRQLFIDEMSRVPRMTGAVK